MAGAIERSPEHGRKAAGRSASRKNDGKRAKAKPGGGAPGGMPDQAAMMKAWQKAMTPAKGHQLLEPLVGTWDAKVTFTMMPGSPPEVNAGVSKHRWVLGGRYIEQRYKGRSMGMPFEGLGYIGFDNAQGKYVGTWMDTFGTGLMNSVGTGRPSAKSMSFLAEAYEPSGQKIEFECKLRIKDQDHHTYEMWTKLPDGKLHRSMLVEYSRRST